MIIVIDAILSPVKPRGVARYTTELIKGLAELDSENTYYVFYGSWMRSYDFLQVQQPNFHFIEKDIKTGMLPRNLYKCFVLPLLAKKLHGDVFHPGAWIVNCKLSNCKWVNPCGDLLT